MTAPKSKDGSHALAAVGLLTQDRAADGGAVARAVAVGIARMLGDPPLVLAGSARAPEGLGDLPVHRLEAGTPRVALAVVSVQDPSAEEQLRTLLGKDGIGDGAVLLTGCGAAPPPVLERLRPTSVPKVVFLDELLVPASTNGADGLAVVFVDASNISYSAPDPRSAATAPSSSSRSGAQEPAVPGTLARLTAAQEQLARERAGRLELAARLCAIYESPSWKAAKPLRLIEKIARRIRRGR